jgi:hypothetical protein
VLDSTRGAIQYGVVDQRWKCRTLDALARNLSRIGGVRRDEIQSGDRIVVSTRNSIYSIRPQEDGTYEVAGGWFDRSGAGPARIRIHGCTAGGSALLKDYVAAPGLFLEFGNCVKTTRIRTVRVIRESAAAAAG